MVLAERKRGGGRGRERQRARKVREGEGGGRDPVVLAEQGGGWDEDEEGGREGEEEGERGRGRGVRGTRWCSPNLQKMRSSMGHTFSLRRNISD